MVNSDQTATDDACGGRPRGNGVIARHHVQRAFLCDRHVAVKMRRDILNRGGAQIECAVIDGNINGCDGRSGDVNQCAAQGSRQG
ncbi:hypothetical protein D3C80_1580160 [compost metagenome]